MALVHPFTSICVGPSGAGKTQFVLKLIENIDRMISPNIDEIIWGYTQWQDSYLKPPQVQFYQGIPKLEKSNNYRLLVIDDQMDYADIVSSIFTKESHHKNVSVIYIVQNLFYAHKDMRTVHLNCHYLIMFKSPRDMSSVSVLAKQMFPGKARFLRSVFADATQLPHSYLLIDFKQSTPDHLRLRTNIFPFETMYVYVKKGARF